jgi:hypothetical protein
MLKHPAETRTKMGSQSESQHPPSNTRRRLQTHIARQRDVVLDYEIVVDDPRAALDRHVQALRTAVRDRDRAAVHLANLIAWHDELEAHVERVGPGTPAGHIAMLNEEPA